VHRTPSSVATSPTIDGRRPNRFAHVRSDRTTTGSAPFSSSLVVITRPRSGAARSIVNMSEVVTATSSETASPLPVIVTAYPEMGAIASRVFDCSRQSLMSGSDALLSSSPRTMVLIDTRREASANGSGLSSTPLTMLKMAVLAPMPTASTITTIALKPGDLMRVRSAWRRSVSMKV
jgi:hypothetical protein